MQLNTSWQLVTTATGALVQKHGGANVVLAYAAVSPTTEDTFGLGGSEPILMPEVTGLNIYAKTTAGIVNLSVQAV